MTNICDVMNSMMLTAYGDITFPGRYWSLFLFICIRNINRLKYANCMYCHHIPMQAFFFQPFEQYCSGIHGLSGSVVFLKIILRRQKDFWKKKKACNMNCVFSVQLLSETLLLPVQGVVQWGLTGRHDVTNRRFCNSANPPKKQAITWCRAWQCMEI